MKIDEELAAAAATNHHLLTTAARRAAGCSDRAWRSRLAADEWIEIVPNVASHRSTVVTWDMRVRAAAAWAGRDAGLFGGTALRWHGAERGRLPTSEFDGVRLLVPRHRSGLAPWITLHTTTRWRTSDLHVVEGVRSSTVTRAIIDLAGRCAGSRAIEEALDWGCRNRYTSIPTVLRTLTHLDGTGRPGSPLLRELLLDSGGESYLARRFLRLVRLAGLPRPACQIIYRDNGRTVARVDFQFGACVVVEVSGRLGHASDRDRQRDARRRNELQHRGRTVLEFTTADVIDDPGYTLATLRTALRVAA